MKIFPFLGTILLCSFPVNSKAQQLKVNDTIPDKIYTSLLNYEHNQICLKDYRGKIIILEFWSHYCINCIKSFPLLDSIQRQFSNQIQIILVNKESRDSTIHFFAKRKYIKMPNLPLITGDNQLSSYFRHEGYPYNVWINKEGVIKNVGNNNDITNRNINKFLKEDYSESGNAFDKRKADNAVAKNISGLDFTYYSYLCNCSDQLNVGHASRLKMNDKSFRISDNCTGIIELFKKAYEQKGKYQFKTPASILVKVKDSSKYFVPNGLSYSKWKKINTYTYDLVVPQFNGAEIFNIMQNDLSRAFNIDAKIEARYVKGLVLVRTSNIDKLKSKGGTPVNTLKESTFQSPIEDSIRLLVNRPFSFLVDKISSIVENTLQIPFFNEAGYFGNIDLQFMGSTLDNINLERLQKELRNYDLDLLEATRIINVLVLTER